MTNAQLIAACADAAQVKKAVAERLVKELCATIRAQLAAGQKVAMGDLGIFKPVQRAAKVGRNPKDGSVVEIPARRSVKFSLSRALKEALQ